MKLTVKELIQSANDFTNGNLGAFGRFNKVQKPMQTALRMKQIVREFNTHVADYLDQRAEIANRLGKENNGVFEFEDDNRVKFNLEHEALLASVVEITGARIRPSQLLSSTTTSEDDLIVLEWLIDDGISERIEPQEAEVISEDRDEALPTPPEVDQTVLDEVLDDQTSEAVARAEEVNEDEAQVQTA